MINEFALIIGGMKCGSTSLFHYLSQHPQIAPCTDKEPCFFSIADKFNLGLDWYRNLWNWDVTHHKVALEASTSYTRIPTYINAAENIAKTGASFKFIYILRDPFRRIESHYTQAKAEGRDIAIKPLSDYIHPDLIYPSQYFSQISEYYQRFPAENILLINLSCLKTKPAEILKRVCDFLNIDSNFDFDNIHENLNQNIGRIGQDPMWRRMRKVKTLKRISSVLTDQQKYSLHKLFGKEVSNIEHLLPEQKKYLSKILSQELIDLQREYNFDAMDWALNK